MIMRQIHKCIMNNGERDARSLRNLDNGNPTKNGTVIASLIPLGSPARDQPFLFVEMHRGNWNPTALCNLTHCKRGFYVAFIHRPNLNVR